MFFGEEVMGTAKSKLLLSLLLALATLGVYSPVLRNGFISYDDDRYVTDNPQVQAGLKWTTVSWAFTTFEQANWHPLSWISHALDWQIFRLNPSGHHFTSLIFHCVNVLLLFQILCWFTGSTLRSALVAAVFAIHPLNVESVAWVAERKTLLSMMFFLLAIAAYGWYVKRPGIARYLLVMLLFAAGLMSKPMMITLPFVLLLLDYWPLSRMRLDVSASDTSFAPHAESIGKLCLEKLPLLFLSLSSAVVTMLAQHAGGAVVSTNRISLTLRIGNAVVSYGLYLKKMVWPSNLAILYPFPQSLPWFEIAAAAVLLVLITAGVLAKHQKARYLAVGWFWYLGTLVPMIGLVQVGNQAMADRYAYLPLVGPFLMIVWGLADWAQHRAVDTRILAAASVAAMLALSWTTHIQLSYWHDDFRLWTHTLAVNPRNYVAENNFGLALARQGRRDLAAAHFRSAAALAPNDATSQLNLGVYAQEEGHVQQAVMHYQRVLELAADPQLRASAYANLGTISFANHDYPRAKQYFDSVLQLNRPFPIVLQDLGLIALRDGEHDAAIGSFSRLVTLQPSDVNYFLLARAFHQAGRDADAVWAYQQAVHFSKDIAQTRKVASQLAGE
jgi:protein O-mannosyl-transferase